MLDGQPHGNGSIVYMANDKFGRANYTGIWHNIFGKIFAQTTQVFWSKYWSTFFWWYSGEWRFGTITGVGTMHWKSGARWLMLKMLTMMTMLTIWCWYWVLKYQFLTLMLNMRTKISFQVYRADSYEPDGRPGQVGLKMLVFLCLPILSLLALSCFLGLSGPMVTSTLANTLMGREMA